MTYYDDLIKDEKRVSVFKKAILDNASGITYDLGTGSGILASFASKKAEKVYAIEINPLVIKHYTTKFLQPYKNVTIIEADLNNYIYKEKPDVVICEMLDTALIDEEQVPVINNVLKFSKKDTIFIPKSTYDMIQLGYANINHITYQENGNVQFNPLSEEKIYNKVVFSKKINPNFKKDINMKITENGLINCFLIKTYTEVSDDLITEPTLMLNPPLLIPLKEKKVNAGDILVIELEYVMGGGLNTIKANYK